MIIAPTPAPSIPSQLHSAESVGDPRFAASAFCGRSRRISADFLDWFEQRRLAHRFEVRRIPFAAMDHWRLDPFSGNVVHDSGRFFSIEGLRVRTAGNAPREWSQPIMNQPENGVLGLLVREVDGHFQFLVQAKMEPGNCNLTQVSPTVQATRSNYTGVHRGAEIAYLEHFMGPRRGRVLVDVLQSEQGDSFYRKRNRNMIVEVDGEVALHEDFRWVTLGQLNDMLRIDNLVNMDTRTVLSCVPLHAGPGLLRDLATSGSSDPFRATLAASLLGDDRAVHATTELLSWLTELRSVHEIQAERVPLAEVADWSRSDDEIAHRGGQYPSIVAVKVRAANREVREWTQPLMKPRHRGLAAFVIQRIEGVPHVLVQARAQAGLFDIYEFAPTVQCVGADHRALPADRRPAFLDYVRRAPAAQIRYSALLSEEGGRFYHRENHYVVVQAPDDARLDVPATHRFVTPDQLKTLVRHSAQVNVEARTLLACLQTLL